MPDYCFIISSYLNFNIISILLNAIKLLGGSNIPNIFENVQLININ